MIRLTKVLQAWGKPDFEAVLKAEVEGLGAGQLPLQQGMSASSYVLDDNIRVMLLNATEAEGILRVTVGVFYKGIIAGCSCADDPTPIDEQNEYCEMRIDIHMTTAEAAVSLIET